MAANKAFFLDRDGTINIDYDYVHKKEEWTWCTRAIESIKWMNDNGYLVIIVTNQSGVSRAKYTEAQVHELHDWVNAELAKHEAKIDAFYIAPWHPQHHNGIDYPQEDRKPNTGMFDKAALKFDIDFSQSYMIGDKQSDIDPALKLGIKSFLVESRHTAAINKEWLSEVKMPIYKHIGKVIDFITE